MYDEEGLLPDPLVLKDKAAHTRMKRNGASACSMAGALQRETFMDVIADRLIRILDQKHDGAVDAFDLGYYLHLYATDAVFSLSSIP